ncbi:MFS transporter [Paenibacillus physcomitrellae]|uniref:MFS transporter n=1 Tax=Paenibacillus physcomitrellae TaxID=1619311 RepID=A0ABQ1G1K4_9BACL|nr:glycoside-pentoside-hexuronide (GPH):cation symporter [Paenibacillus physcomitrellae]GGA34829.1 MFS transporter [Paenibacillus physcomitrellae]
MDKEVLQNNNVSSDQLKTGRLLGYGIGDLGYSLVWILTSTFLSYYYTDSVGIAAGAVGTLLLLTRVLDGISDIAMGIVIDRTKSKHGKARPWIFRMALPLGISTVLLFSVPSGLSTGGKIVFAAATYVLMNLIYTAANIPYNTLLALITQNQYSRSLANIFRMFFAIGASIIASSATIPLVKAFGGGQSAWATVAVLYSIVMIVILFFLFRYTKEVVGNAGEVKDNVPLKVGIKALFSNKYWLLMLLIGVFTYIGSGLQGAGIYYAQYILGNSSYLGIISTAGLLPVLIGMLFIAPLIKKFGKRNIAIFGGLLGLVGNIIKLTNPNSLTCFIIGSVVSGFGGVPLTAVLYAMVNDTVEYGEWKSGVRTEGLVNSAASFGIKVGTGLGTAMLGWLLQLGGYVGGAATQSHLANSMILALNIYIPMVIGIITLIFLWMYKLDKKYPVILEDLKQRKSSIS